MSVTLQSLDTNSHHGCFSAHKMRNKYTCDDIPRDSRPSSTAGNQEMEYFNVITIKMENSPTSARGKNYRQIGRTSAMILFDFFF